ncbi:MAG: hypothetical protein WCV64_06705 [Desulfurivibrionaceae bacterium]
MKEAEVQQGAVAVREIPFQDIPQIRPLFRQVFGGDLSPEMLAWKYGEGRGRSYGAFAPDGTLVAHCGTFYRLVLADGQSRRIAQLGDLMALPGKLGGLSRFGSPFALLIRKVLADLPGEANPDGLAFGFPSDRAMRLGEHLGFFSSIDRMCELVLSPLASSWQADRCAPISPSDNTFMAVADRLWQQMGQGLGHDLIGVRDAAYLQQRYFRHPSSCYGCHLISSRWFGRPLGLLITRMDGEQCELLDIIAHPSRMGRLLQAARQQMEDWGAATMKLWLTEKYATLYRPLADSFSQLEIRIMASPFSSANHPERFVDRWWLTSGDTDYR